jgi:hypothetical protein
LVSPIENIKPVEYAELYGKLDEIKKRTASFYEVSTKQTLSNDDWDTLRDQVHSTFKTVSDFSVAWNDFGFTGPNAIEPVNMQMTESAKFSKRSFNKIASRLSFDEVAARELRNFKKSLLQVHRRSIFEKAEDMKAIIDNLTDSTDLHIESVTDEIRMLEHWIDRASVFYEIQLDSRMYRLQFIVIGLAIVAIVAPFGPSILHWLGL